MWLPEDRDLDRAAREALLAVQLWEAEPQATRSLDDEMLAHIYAATSLTGLGRIESAAEAVQPVLSLPEERRISWMRKRLVQLRLKVDQGYSATEAGKELSAAIGQVSG